MTSSDTRTAPEVGSTLPSLTVRLTRTDLVRYAGASTDFNPIHYSERFASGVGLPGVVAHGMLTLGIALRAVTDWAGDRGRVVSCSTRFTRPVVVPDDDAGAEVTVVGSITEVDGQQVSIALEVTSGGAKVLGGAKAVVDLG